MAFDKEKPKIDEYKKWLTEEQNVNITGLTREYYDSVVSIVLANFKKSFWKDFVNNSKEYKNEYEENTGGYDLWEMLPTEKQLLPKPYDSFLSKTFRKNIKDNSNWPECPDGGWFLPENWFSKINDIVRTRFTVKYFDGVKFMVTKISEYCKQKNMDCESSFEAKGEGYYAAHLHLKKDYVLPSFDWDTEKSKISVEIQIRTRFQEVVQSMLHGYYEQRRNRYNENDTTWQWEYKSKEFSLNHLAHMLHYIDGMITELRETQKEDI